MSNSSEIADNNQWSEQVFNLNISPDDYLLYYKGSIANVLVQAESGLKIKFPANLLRSYVTSGGVFGKFKLRYDLKGKVLDFSKIS